MPGGADLSFRVAGLEQASQFRVGGVVESFGGDGHQFAAPVERIGLATAVTERFALDAAADLVEHEVRELHDVERISDLRRVREHRVEHRPIRARQIERRPSDLGHPVDGLVSEPSACSGRVAARHNIEQLSSPGVDNLCRPQSSPELAVAAEQHLVEAADRGETVADD